MRRIALCTMVGFCVWASAVAAGSLATGSEEQLDVIVPSGEYRIVSGDDGQKIVMEGFGDLMEPGKPMLPQQRVLIALPPGALVREIVARGVEQEVLPGSYQIVAAPAPAPLGDPAGRYELAGRMQQEWQRNHSAVYTVDERFPGDAARLVTSGSLRKYAYAAVAVRPFSYRPLSGTLIHHEAVQVTVRFSLPEDGTARAVEVDRLRQDRVADRKAAELFVNFDQIEHLYASGQPATTRRALHDYLIVTTEALAPAVSASGFVGWKTALGYSVRTVMTDDPLITGQPGGDLAEQIRNFLRSYYGPWGIEYVLLVGDYATVPMRYGFPDRDDHTHFPGNLSNSGGSVPTDYYYADLSLPDAVSWDSDGDGFLGEYLDDSPDFLAEVYVGRIPTSDTVRVTYTLDKLVAFEQDIGAWKDRALLPGSILFYENQDHGGYPKLDGNTLLYLIENDFMTGWTVSRYSEQGGLSPSVFPWPAVSVSAFIDDWRTGQYGIVNWSGHGAAYGVGRTVWDWDDGDGVPETDGSDVISSPMLIDAWCNLDDDHPSLVFAVSCNVGYPEPNGVGNLGIDLLTRPGFGASAGIVSSSRPAWVSIDVISNPAGAEIICYEYNHHLIGEGKKQGEAMYDAKHFCYQNYGWDHYAEHINQFNFDLYGDPAMVRTDVSTAVAGSFPGSRASAHLYQNHPNPFNPATLIRFDLAQGGTASLRIYDLSGALVRTLHAGAVESGSREVVWTGVDDLGRRVASGVYFCRLETSWGQTQVKKLVMVQ